MVTIARIEEAGPDRRARLIVFDNTETLRTAREVVKALGLEEGATFTRIGELREQVDTAELEQARDRLLRILNSRDRTEFEARDRLRKDGYGHKAIDTVVGRFVEVGLIDDARYTEVFINGSLTAKRGWNRIRRDLQQRGIDIEGIEPPTEDAELQRALDCIARIEITDRKSRDKALRKMVSRGFAYPIALKALETKTDTVLD
ncbi:MAG: recombination regulator RecX [Actinomycetes bacterium]|jgi:regulatory protein|nr:recombination regulator RecX [Actinomycetes bacterium]